MKSLRLRLSWILVGWLFVQFAGTVAPVVLAAAGVPSGDVLCECPGTEHGATCPMHHGQAPKQDDTNRCRLQNTYTPTDAALLSLAGGIGVLPQVATLHIDMAQTSILATDGALSSRTELPDAPPPRS